MHQAVEERGDHDHVAEQPRPVFDRAIGGHDRGGAFVATHQDVGQLLAGVGGQLAQEQIVDDEQLGGLDVGAQFLELAELAGFGEVLDELVGFAVEDLVATVLINKLF